ncbi:MAG: FkbM family methyltransferase [Shimia sp.]
MSLLARLTDRVTGAKARRRAAMHAAWDAAVARLGPGDLTYDLGANVGRFTTQLAATGADVVAYEPHPLAHAELIRATEGHSNVTVVNAAVGAAAGTFPLHIRADGDALKATTSASLLSENPRLTEGQTVDVQVIDLPARLLTEGRRIALMKVDIEGAEVELFEALEATGALDLIDAAFVETHERQVPSLAPRLAALKVRTEGRAINWDWM